MATRTYNDADLLLRDPTSLAWAVAFFRWALRDTPNDNDTFPEPSMTDAEVQAQVEAFTKTDAASRGGDGTVYYRPHAAAASTLISNPAFLQKFSGGGYSEEYPNPQRTAMRFFAAHKWIDDSITDSTNGRVSAGQLVAYL